MKTIFFGLLLTLVSFAQSNQDLARQLEVLNNPAPEVTCSTCDPVKHLTTTDEALAELNDPAKTFLGRKNLYGHDQNYTCVYKTARAYVLYHNCMGSRRENNALDFEVIPFDGNIVGFSMENNNIGLPSTLRRNQYNMNWQVSLEEREAPGPNLNVDQLNAFLAADPLSGSCYIGGTFKAQDLSLKAQCSDRIKNADTENWKKKATEFWLNPGDSWYNAIRESRRRMTSF